MAIAAVVGLGNPGEAYSHTRHNLGFQVVDEVAQRWRLTRWRHQCRSLVVRRSGGSPVLLVKPQTFMNLSGEAVAALCRGESLLPDQCLVVVDDVDLPLGQIRLRSRGGAGSHNGLRSLVSSVGEGFPRLRIGICGEAPWRDLAAYVLAPFAMEELEPVSLAVKRAADCVEMAVREGISRASARFNSRVPEVGPEEHDESGGTGSVAEPRSRE